MDKIYLFGTPRIEENGVLVQIPRRKSIALLAYLVITQVPHHRDELASMFYPELDRSHSRSNLRRDLYDLKSALVDDILLLERDQISLQPSAQNWVDANEFLTLAEQVASHHQPSQPGAPKTLCADCRRRLAQAVELYSADFMAGFTIADSREFEDWQFFQSELLSRKLADSLEQLVSWHAERGEYDLAINYASRWLSLDVLNEIAQRKMMRLYAWSGQPAAALRQYAGLKEMLHQQLGAEPDGETTALYEEIRKRRIEPHRPAISLTRALSSIPVISSSTQHNLPIPDGPLIGRNNELDQAVNLLRDDPNCRLLTILGPGGMGKTRLAIDIALRQAEDKACPFCEGIFYVSLTAVTQPEAMIMAIASILKIPLVAEPDLRKQQVLNYLQTKRLLLVLDNFEQLINPPSIQLLVDIFNQAPHVKLLVTSRSRLNIYFEHLLPLQGLDFPKIPAGGKDVSVETIEEFGAIQLFLGRARIQKPDYTIKPNEIQPIVEICQMVEGMPLGIELAASWLDVLTPAEILGDIKQSLDFLTSQWPDKPEKHHNLRAVFDSSWKLLTEQERAALTRLTVFQSSFSRQSALAVSGASIELLQSIKNKSWLKLQPDGSYQIHDLLCQFASEQLQSDSIAWQQTKQRYTDYYSTQLDQLWRRIKGPGQREAYDWMSKEFENIRLAWNWLVEAGQIELAVQTMLPVLFRYSEARAKPFELIQLIDLAYDSITATNIASSPPLWNAILLVARAAFSDFGYPFQIGIHEGTPQEKLIRQAWQSVGKMEILIRMDYWGMVASFLYAYLADTPAGVEYLQELSVHYKMQNQSWNLALVLSLLGSVQVLYYLKYAKYLPLLRGAEETLNEALEIFSMLDDKHESSSVLWMLGQMYNYEGKYDNAIDKLQTALAFQDEVGEFVLYGEIMEELARCYTKLGDHQSALRCFHQARLKLRSEGQFLAVANSLHDESIHSAHYGDLDHALQTRQESIDLYHQAGNDSGIAWGMWEMGELYRISGNLTLAQDWFSRARLLFKKLEDKSINIFLARTDGDLASMAGDYRAAKKHYERSAEFARETNFLWALSYALCGLAKAESAILDRTNALQHYTQAIQIARSIDHYELVINALAGYTQILASSGDVEQAVELGSWITDNKLTWNETKHDVKALLSTLSLSADLFEACKERSKFMDVERAVSLIAQTYTGSAVE
jgi:predicted ATPase/DNA-binding SARP family transcriptional activator/tetratricopeptide (TPR) repeat protein